MLTISILLAVIFITDIVLSHNNSPTKLPKQGTKLASGPENGTYSAFSKIFAENVNDFADIKQSNGSINNLDLLKTKGADFAIIQSDTVYFAYNGLKDFKEQKSLRLILPLFEEKVRLFVVNDGSVKSLADLKERNICVGTIDSGTYFNAITLLSGIGLTADFNFIPIYENSASCIQQAKQRDISAFISTSHLPSDNLDGFEEKIIPLSVIDKIIEDQPYFRRMVDGEKYHLAVDAYLVTTKNISNVQATRLAYQLEKNWDNIRREIPTLPKTINGQFRSSIPKHNGVVSFIENGSKKGSSLFLSPLFISIWITLLLLCLFAERHKSTYNRLGESTLDAWAERVIIGFIGKFSQVLIALSIAFFSIIVAVCLLKFAENVHGKAEGVQSPFLDLNFVDSMMWLFSYISSGFTTDGIYPNSVVGQIIVAILAIAGVLGPFTAIIYLLNVANKRARNFLMGFGQATFRNHVLICGWNEKVPGIIYTLTGQDVDERKKVVVIGDMASNNPFELYKFDPKFVSFIRGAPSDLDSLSRANAADADSAIILADLNTSEERNADSILTAMHIRRVNPNIHICSELEYQENADLFKACGADVIIDAHNIIARLAAIAVSSPEVIDYVLDTISYHDFDELYSVNVSEEASLVDFVGVALRDLELELLNNGINVVGLLEEQKATNVVTMDEFSSMSNLTALVDQKDSQKIITDKSVIVYASKDRNQLREFRKGKRTFEALPIPDQKFVLNLYPKKRIFACGDKNALNQLKLNLQVEGANYDLTMVDTSSHELNTFEDVKRHVKGQYDTVIILLGREVRASFTNEHELHNIDARNVLITRLVQKVFENQEVEPIIISEVLSIRNKQLFIDAGAETILPSSLTVERFLTKEVFDNTSVLQYVLALLNRSDGVFLHSHTVTERDGFCGYRYKDILVTEIEGLRIVGWLPVKSRPILTNKQNDFDYHFRTVVDDRNTSEEISIGDVLILIIRPREQYYSLN